MTDCAAWRHDLGGYVLGGLDADAASGVQAHLAGCAACRAEQAELADTAVLLAAVDEAPPRVPARVRDRVVADATRRRLRRRWTGVVAVAATLAALAGAVAGWQLSPPPPIPVAVPLEDVEPFDVAGWATFATDDDGVVVRLDLDGLEPLDEPAVYEAWLSTGDDGIVSIGQLEAPQGRTLTVELAASGSLADYRYVWVTAEPDAGDPAHEGPTVLRAPVPDSRAPSAQGAPSR